MIGAAKRVLVVEDDQSVRDPLVGLLRDKGLEAEGVATVEQTRDVFSNKPAFDVAVLDQGLKNSSSSGIAMGFELRERQPDSPTEFIVYSAHSDTAAYDEALKLGIFDYVVKGTPEAHTLIDRIQLAALKSALNPIRPDLGERIERIAEEDLKVSTAVHQLCTEIIKPELDVCLGVPSIILVHDEESTRVLDGNVEPGSEHLYGEIHRQLWRHYGATSFTFSKEDVRVSGNAADIINGFDGGSFVSIQVMDQAQLCLGILPPKTSAPSWLEIDFSNFDLGSFVTPPVGNFQNIELGSYVDPPIRRLLKYLSRIEKAVEASKRKTLLGHTSRFCLYVAQTQMEILNEVAEDKVLSATPGFQKLRKLALDLQATGNEFSMLSESAKHREAPERTSPPVSVKAVVKRAWNEMKEHVLLTKLELSEKGDDFNLPVDENDLFVAVLRVLQWLAQREDKVSTETPTIDVEYSRHNDRLQISFTDQSRRLGGELRQKLFEPFTQIATTTKTPKDGKDEQPGLYLPLYLAKTLIETKNNGLLEDRTDELPKTTKVGHRFTISFPAEEDNP